MTGSEQWSAAQDALQDAVEFHNGGRPDTAGFYLKKAQVHATLALAAATVLSVSAGSVMPREWFRVLGLGEDGTDTQ